jgi:cathepsin L
LGYKSRPRHSITTASHRWAPHRNVSAPRDSLDWRNSNAVTDVKDQGTCGACWSFSATGSIEGAWAIAKGTLVSLSEQQLIDCSTAQGNQGCNGGLMDDAFTYVEANGIGSEDSYPYTATGPNTCQSVTTVATISSFVDVTPLNEADLLSAVNIGPVSIAIEADQPVFQYYSSGVLDSSACGTTLDHGVLIVGYGTSTEDYWIVKNSWGSSWGQSGYVYLARNKNTCGLAQDPSYPVV